jgi:hypothetical protein
MRTDAQLGKRPNRYGAESYWKDWSIGESLQFTTLGGGSDNDLHQILVVLTCLGGLGTSCLTPNIGTVAQWLRCCATNQKVASSIPAGVSGLFIDIKSFRSHYGPGVDSASNRNEYNRSISWG